MLVVSKSSRGFDTVACGLFDGSKVLKLRFAMNKGVQTFCSKVSFLPEKRVHSVMGVPFRYRKLERKKPRLPVKNILPHIYVKKLCVSRPKIIPAVNFFSQILENKANLSGIGECGGFEKTSFIDKSENFYPGKRLSLGNKGSTFTTIEYQPWR